MLKTIDKMIDKIVDYFVEIRDRRRERLKKEKARAEEEKQLEILREKKEQERLEKIRKIEERKAWETARQHRHKNYQKLIQNIEKRRGKIITNQEFNKPIIKEKKNGAVLSFKGKEFLFCEQGHELFRDDFFKEEYYDLLIDDGYLARKHKRKEFIQYFHRWLMMEEVNEFAFKEDVENKDVEVHHIDQVPTNNKIKNLKPMLKDDHKKLHIRLKFDGSDDDFDDWYRGK